MGYMKYFDDGLCIQTLMSIVDKLLLMPDNSNKYFMTIDQFSTSIINLSLYKKENNSSKRIRIYKLDLSKYRITIFSIYYTSYGEKIEEKSVKRLNVVSYDGKKLFIDLFVKLFKYVKLKYLRNKYDDHTTIDIIDKNKSALDDISHISHLILDIKSIKGEVNE